MTGFCQPRKITAPDFIGLQPSPRLRLASRSLDCIRHRTSLQRPSPNQHHTPFHHKPIRKSNEVHVNAGGEGNSFMSSVPGKISSRGSKYNLSRAVEYLYGCAFGEVEVGDRPPIVLPIAIGGKAGGHIDLLHDFHHHLISIDTTFRVCDLQGVRLCLRRTGHWLK